MTTPLVQRLREAIDTNMMDGSARRALHKIADELDTSKCCGNAGTFACNCNTYTTPSRAGGGEVGELFAENVAREYSLRRGWELHHWNDPACKEHRDDIIKDMTAALHGAGARGGENG